ncbi:helix-turn-helix transcriptional regulator [Actinosynnema sp. CS-041913]|uniref:helix-turn-helix transcriptional regulator n=1 Tax=Actinosynnema sp. CS-041913 TaxID=3239917 RepID=UPI003D8A0C29
MTGVGNRLRHELSEASGRGISSEHLGAVVSREIASVVAHEALRLEGTNPTLGSGPGAFEFWHGYEADLVRAGGDHRSDQDTQRLFGDHGVGCELRLTLRDGRGVWGTLRLLRARGVKPFEADDARRIADLGPSLIAALRGYVTAGPLAPTVPLLPPGVMIVGPDHKVRSVTPQARSWHRLLAQGHNLPDWASAAFVAELSVVTRAHARDPRARPPVVYGPAASYGRWVAMHGQPLDSSATGDVAVLVQAATGALLLPAFCDWYGITTRERQVVAELYDGAAPKQIARRLDLSVHTVNDHLKAVFHRTGAGGRDELVAALGQG